MAGNIILGAGIAGLGAAYASNYQYPIYESNTYAGGLCSSFEMQGFRFDRAVHLSFATSDIVRNVLDPIPHYCHHPYPQNWYYDRWVKHPIQNNLYALPVEKRICAVRSFIERPTQLKTENFMDWSISRFGRYISEEFSVRYNKKYWCEDLNKLGVSWIGNRLYQPNIDEILRGSLTEDTPNTYYAKEMRYPKRGGYQSFLSGLTERAHIYFNKHVTEIDGEHKQIFFSDGTSVPYQTAFSSIPLTEMGRIVKDIPAQVVAAIDELNYTGVALVSMGLRKEIQLKNIWFYIYDSDILAARVYSPSLKSPDNAPLDCSSLQFEIYYNGKSVPPPRERCIQNTILALERMAASNALEINVDKDILFMDYRVQDYGNIIMYPDNGQNASLVKNFLRQISVIPIGRFGEWDYLWSDQAFLSGYWSVNRLEGHKV